MITADAREHYELRAAIAANEEDEYVIKTILHVLHKCHREHQCLHIPSEQRWLAYLQ